MLRRAFLPWLAVALAGASALAQDEEDDPAFAREVAVPDTRYEDEPVPAGGVAPRPALDTASAPPIHGHARRPRDHGGIHTRLAYRTLTLVEAASRPAPDTPQVFAAQRFHALVLDVYPVSG